MNNLEMMRERLIYYGGIHQEDRMIKDKHRTFIKSLRYSYQGCDIQKVQNHDSCEQLEYQPVFRALINPDQNKQDYDDKILSADYRIGLQNGDIFCWTNTNSYWIVTLNELTEDAYFRSDIRRCKYKIKFKDNLNKVHETWAAIRGPVETQIDLTKKNQTRIDSPNLTLNILLPANSLTIASFDRYKEFIFDGKCWQVQAVDSISMTNVLEINAKEYIINKDTDDMEKEIKNGLVIEKVDLGLTENIRGHNFIKPKIEEKFWVMKENGNWKITDVSNCKVDIKTRLLDNNTVCFITWNNTLSGQFKIKWTSADGQEKLEKQVIVESLL